MIGAFAAATRSSRTRPVSGRARPATHPAHYGGAHCDTRTPALVMVRALARTASSSAIRPRWLRRPFRLTVSPMQRVADKKEPGDRPVGGVHHADDEPVRGKLQATTPSERATAQGVVVQLYSKPRDDPYRPQGQAYRRGYVLLRFIAWPHCAPPSDMIRRLELGSAGARTTTSIWKLARSRSSFTRSLTAASPSPTPARQGPRTSAPSAAAGMSHAIAVLLLVPWVVLPSGEAWP
jgi:hypothetical protein